MISSYEVMLEDAVKHGYIPDSGSSDPLRTRYVRPTVVLPVDVIGFNFTRIDTEYRPQKSDGTFGPGLKTGYNAKTGSKV